MMLTRKYIKLCSCDAWFDERRLRFDKLHPIATQIRDKTRTVLRWHKWARSFLKFVDKARKDQRLMARRIARRRPDTRSNDLFLDLPSTITF